VHYASDLDHVERVTCEVGRGIMKSVPGAVADFEPFIRYHTFGESSIDFTVILRAREFGDNFVVKHEFIKALMRAFKAERIVIPYPIRAVNLEQEGVRLDRVDGRAIR
jgi:small-conductance mechanosensitive channel